MATAVSELALIPFENIIGGPLKAAVEAQALAALSTVDFIKDVGLEEPPANSGESDWKGGRVRTVSFTYRKTNEAGAQVDAELTVPILAILPVPFIRIETVTINFKAKLNDMTVDTRQRGKGFTAGGSFATKKIGLRAGYASQSSSASLSTTAREYSLEVSVKAVQDAMPAGLSRVLDMLEASISAEPKAITLDGQLNEAELKFAQLYKQKNPSATSATVAIT